MMKEVQHNARLESTLIRTSTQDAPATAIGVALPLTGVACRGARAMLGVSQTELAEAAGCGRNLLNDFENGVSLPRAGNAARIREALESLGAVFLQCKGGIAVGVEADSAKARTPRARSIGGV